MPQFKKSGDDKYFKIKKTIEKNIKDIKNTITIHSIKAIYDNFEENILPSLLESLDSNDKKKIINTSTLKIENEKLFLESEQDVIEYIEIFKTAILEQIKLGNKIRI